MTEQLSLLSDPPRRRRTAALRSFHTQGQPVGVAEALTGEQRAQRQDDAVLAVMRRAGRPLTPSELHAIIWGQDHYWPITSIRRALTNLTKRGLLQHYKHDRRPGPLGAMESTWGIAER